MLMDRTGMPVNDAKLELKVRGINDPAKLHSYSNVVTTHNKHKESQHSIAVTHLSPSSTTHESPRVQLQQTSPVTSPLNRSETNSRDMEKSTEVNNPDLETHILQ